MNAQAQQSQQSQQQGFCLSFMEAARATDAVMIPAGGNETLMLSGVSTDTRSIKNGELFVALHGPNFNGNDFVPQAMAAGAAACMVDKTITDITPQLQVRDTRLALGQLASYWRNKFTLPLVAVTGSNGKTTVKEMLRSIFTQQGEALATRGNLNNDIGVPLTLFRLHQGHKHAVIEMGANHPGEIGYLTSLAKPTVAVITNAAAAHLEGFGSLQGVAQAKGEIYSGLGAGGCAIINADDQFAGLWRELINKRSEAIRILSFGIDNQADVRADSATLNIEADRIAVSIDTPAGRLDLKLPLLGRHNLMNAMAATAAALAAGISLEAIRAGLESMQAVAGRLQLKNGINGSRIIDDTYNANPASMQAALEVLSQFKGRQFFALGDMGELGENEQALHETVVQQAQQNRVDQLFTLGRLANAAAKTMAGAQTFDSHKAMIACLREMLDKDITLLVKGSRRMQMEKIVNALVDGAQERPGGTD